MLYTFSELVFYIIFEATEKLKLFFKWNLF